MGEPRFLVVSSGHGRITSYNVCYTKLLRALAAAITVIIATQMGLPVSSTHIAVGAVFGVGFLREYLKANYLRMVEEIEMHHQGADRQEVEAFMERFKTVSLDEKAAMLKQIKEHKANAEFTKKERKGLKKA